MKNKTMNQAGMTKILLAVVFISLVFIPILRMFAHITPEGFRAVVQSYSFRPALLHSIISAFLATLLTVTVAYFMALCINRVNMKLKKFFQVLFTLPMLIPSISIGMGLVILFGNNGIITRTFGFSFGIYGLNGIILGSFLYAFPVAFIMISDVMNYEDSQPYEAAQILGIGKIRQFFVISFPYLRKPLISIVFSIFTMIVTDYGVPLMIGGKYATVPVVMYQDVIGRLNFGEGSVYGTILLVPAVVAFILDLLNKDKGNSGFVIKKFEPSNSIGKKLGAYLYCIAISVIVVLPLASFIVLGFTTDYPRDMSFTFANIAKAFTLRAGVYWKNSALMALLVSIFGVVISFMTAYMTARMSSKGSKFLHLSAITSAAVPGIVLGLSYALTFSGSFVYGTIVILVMVNIVHFFSSPYLMMYNSLSKINESLESIGDILGVHRLQIIRDVIIPQSKETLIEMFAYFFVNCMMTISAVSFLANTSTKPISLMINQFEAQMQLELAAIVSIFILATNLAMKLLSFLFRMKRKTP